MTDIATEKGLYGLKCKRSFLTDAKNNMIKQQIRTLGLPYGEILAAIMRIPREIFVPKWMKHLAYSELDIPLSHGRYAFTPRSVTQILQVIELKKTDHILQIGVGIGYLTAILLELSSFVDLYDVHKDLLHDVRCRLEELKVSNVSYMQDSKLSVQRQYDVIILRDMTVISPEKCVSRLAPQGRLMYFEDRLDYISARLVVKNQHGIVTVRPAFDSYKIVNQATRKSDVFSF